MSGYVSVGKNFRCQHIKEYSVLEPKGLFRVPKGPGGGGSFSRKMRIYMYVKKIQCTEVYSFIEQDNFLEKDLWDPLPSQCPDC